MRIKNLVLTSTLALSLIASSLASATTPMPSGQSKSMTEITKPLLPMKHCKHRHGKLLTVQERTELDGIMESLFTEMKPLIKEKQALRLQLMGKIATPNMPWSDVSVVLNKVNENNAKITTLLAKTELRAFQKLGIMLPLNHKQRAYHHHTNCHYAKPISHHQYC